jgi:hypothetical protein
MARRIEPHAGSLSLSNVGFLKFFTIEGLPPGRWFIAPRWAGQPSMDVRDGHWADEISDNPVWKPVRGPLVGGWMKYESRRQLNGVWAQVTDFWIEFDQEAHPFGRFDLDASEIAYEDPTSELRLYVPAPAHRDRVSIWMMSHLTQPGDRIAPCQASLPRFDYWEPPGTRRA